MYDDNGNIKISTRSRIIAQQNGNNLSFKLLESPIEMETIEIPINTQFWTWSDSVSILFFTTEGIIEYSLETKKFETRSVQGIPENSLLLDYKIYLNRMFLLYESNKERNLLIFNIDNNKTNQYLVYDFIVVPSEKKIFFLLCKESFFYIQTRDSITLEIFSEEKLEIDLIANSYHGISYLYDLPLLLILSQNILYGYDPKISKLIFKYNFIVPVDGFFIKDNKLLAGNKEKMYEYTILQNNLLFHFFNEICSLTHWSSCFERYKNPLLSKMNVLIQERLQIQNNCSSLASQYSNLQNQISNLNSQITNLQTEMNKIKLMLYPLSQQDLQYYNNLKKIYSMEIFKLGEMPPPFNMSSLNSNSTAEIGLQAKEPPPLPPKRQKKQTIHIVELPKDDYPELIVGDRVERGEDWKDGDLDGGLGSQGEMKQVVGTGEKGKVAV